MGDVLICAFCQKSSGKITLFSEETLKKCQTVLKLRKKHNLKHKDTVLPSEYTESGYHRECYKSFTGLMKKYFTSESTSCVKNVEKESSVSRFSERFSQHTSLIPELILNKPQSLCTESIAISESNSIPKSMEPQPTTSQEQFYISELEVSENDDSTLDINNPVEYNSTDECNIVCILCNKKKKKIRSKFLPLHETEKEQFISHIIDIIKDRGEYNELLNRLENATGSKIYYHRECRVNFNNKISSFSKASMKNAWHDHREYHEIVFNEISSIIVEDVIKKGRCYLLASLHELYIDSLERVFEENSLKINATFTVQHLEVKIMKVFLKDIKIFNICNKKILAPNYLETVDDTVFENLQSENILQKAALILRKSILQIEKKKIPNKNISAQHLISGEVTLPQQLLDFYFTLLGGSNQRRKKSLKCVRQVRSYCQDIIYGVHNGQVKTSKHIMLGITLKSLTSSRKIIDIINRYGHCISYHGVEELETETTYTSTEKSSLCPEKIKKSPELCTGVAYDNFDRFVETRSGKDTLHDTVGIIYQNIDINTTEECEASRTPIRNYEEKSEDERKRKRRTFEAISIEEIPYPKKPKMINGLQSTTDEMENISSNIKLYNEMDNIWMISHALELPDVPMWVGFNSQIDDNNSPQQFISYLTPINASPTSTSIVLETMKQCKKIAEDLNQPYIQVTYDLAIAKVAFQIQATEKPRFDNIFIHLGPFHIMMAYFKAVGKVISDCGLANVMVDSNLLANGSLNGFLDGKHFNRCKRLHPLIALGLEILHFKSFLQAKNTRLTDDMLLEVERLQKCKLSSFQIENEELKEFINDYDNYKQQTLKGDYGKTAQFYLIYINLIHHYLNLSRSIRIGDFELLKSVLPKITSIFFICNQQNYARWTVKYYDNLLKVAETHPDLYEAFKLGCFGIKRTTKPFSRQPVDLVLEQTINADAARRLTGVIHFTNSISARQRWARNHDIRSTIISQVYQELGLQTYQDVSADLNPHNIQNSIKQLQKFITTFDQYINPFSLEVPKDQLINISSGKAASAQVEAFLLNIEENGNNKRKMFISECLMDISRFEKSIQKSSIDNFSKDYEKKKIKVNDKVQEVKIQRDLFGRMLGISLDYNVDISKILSYPITSMPLSMCHLDGTIYKTDKSVLMKCLEKEIQHEPPSYIDVLIIDGFMLLHTMKNVPQKFGNISKKMLQMITQLHALRIDVIFDQYLTPSIKDYERSQRFESAQREYIITGPDQIRPSDFTKELKNSNFKQALVNFFILHWTSDEIVPFIGNKKIYINFKQCHSFIVNDSNNVVSSVVQELSCPEHEEADTKIIYHACKIDYEANIVIRSIDTDIIVIMLAHMHHLQKDSHVWMLAGTGNNLRYLDLTKIYAQLGESICRSLPGFHAITGCDYNPAFFRKGKLKPYKILKKEREYQEAFIKFGDNKLFENNNEQQNTFNIMQKFICDVYNVGGITDVDAARLQLFINTYTVSDVNEAFNLKKLRNFDASNLPPCKRELLQQFLRANYISTIWNNAHLKNPNMHQPENNGWIREDNMYNFKWFDGDQLPNFISDSLKDETDEEIDIENNEIADWNSSDAEIEDIDYNDHNE